MYNQSIQKILVIRLSAMGDVAITVPAIKALTAQYPNIQVHVISRPFLAPLFTQIPQVTFIPVDTTHTYKGLWGIYTLYKQLRSNKYQAVADLHNVIRSKFLRLLFQLSGVKVASIDKGRTEKKALVKVGALKSKPLTTTFNRYINVFEKLGFTINTSNYYFLKPEILPSDLIKTKIWIGVAPFAQYASKVYPKDLMLKTLYLLTQLNNVEVLLFGGGQTEITELEHWAIHFPNCTVIAGKYSFENELKIISNLNVMLSMDSGNGHLAALYGIPVVTLWGATHPYAGFVPYAQPISNSIYPNEQQYPLLPTSIYGNKTLPEYSDAMRSIEPEIVVEKIMQLLPKNL